MEFKVDIEKAKAEWKELKGNLREEVLEREHLGFAIGEMRIFGKCSIQVLKQYKLMTLKELEEFVSKFSKKGVFINE